MARSNLPFILAGAGVLGLAAVGIALSSRSNGSSPSPAQPDCPTVPDIRTDYVVAAESENVPHALVIACTEKGRALADQICASLRDAQGRPLLHVYVRTLEQQLQHLQTVLDPKVDSVAAEVELYEQNCLPNDAVVLLAVPTPEDILVYADEDFMLPRDAGPIAAETLISNLRAVLA